MRKTAFLWILTVVMIVAFMPITSFGVESKVKDNEFDELQNVLCEADVNPGLRQANDLNAKDSTLKQRKAAHKKLRDLLNGFADIAYYEDTANRLYSLSQMQYDEMKLVAAAATKNCGSNYERIQKIYELVAGEVYFDYDHYYGDKPTTDFGYAAWKSRVTTCAGYTGLCCIFLNSIGIPCAYLHGKNHVYNAAYDKNNEQWVFFDATWGSKNEYRNGKKQKNGFTDEYFDLSISNIAGLNNHECFFKTIILLPDKKDNSRLSLATPDNTNDWPNLDEWMLTVEYLKDVTVEEAALQCTALCGIPVTVLGSGAFCDCCNLQSVELQNSITTIEDSAFYGRTKLENVLLPDSVKTIGSYAFRKCSNLTGIEIPDNVTKIGNYIFADCVNLESVSLPGQAKSIGSFAFSNCKGLQNITIPKGVTSIGNKAFYCCSNLESVIIPNTVTSIESNAFDGCDGVTLYCDSDSYAEKYAVSNDLNYETWIQLEDCDISIDQDEFHVSRDPVRPHITVTYGDTVLVEGVQYEVTETEHNVGEVLLTITGLDNCVGEVVLSYAIVDHQWSDAYTVDTDATCTSDGLQAMHCLTCGASKDAEVIPATGHSFGEWETVEVGQCLNTAGLRERRCKVCGFTEVKNLNESSHNWEDTPTVDVSPKCITDGSQSIHCLDCKARKDSEVIPATGHDLEFHEGKPSTCLTEGYAPYDTCINCDYTSYTVLPPAEHKWSHVIEPPGLLTNGCEYDQCKVCGVETLSTELPGYAAYCVKSFKLKRGKRAITAKWDKRGKTVQKRFDGYQIMYSTNAGMSGAKRTYAGKASSGKKIKNLKKKTRYYIQVRTFKKKNGKTFYSKWSDMKSVRTK